MVNISYGWKQTKKAMNNRNENNMPNKPLSYERRVQLKLLVDVCIFFDVTITTIFPLA